MPKREPVWLTRAHVEGIHAMQLAMHGGLAGMRDVGALESALGRPKHKWHYEKPSLADLAAAYGFAIAKNHAFADGNKRTAMVSMATFLEYNGVAFLAAEPDAVLTMLAVAEGTMSEHALAEWLRENTTQRKRRRKK